MFKNTSELSIFELRRRLQMSADCARDCWCHGTYQSSAFAEREVLPRASDRLERLVAEEEVRLAQQAR